MNPRSVLLAAVIVALPLGAQAQRADSARAQPATPECSQCAVWNKPHAPFKVFGNTYYVGTDGLSAILVTSPTGHVLIDGGLAESAPHIMANIRTLGFRVEDVKLILNSHAHYDHAGGIAALQRATSAAVAALPWSAQVMRTGKSIAGDPQLGLDIPYPPVTAVRVLKDREMARAGSVALTAHSTAGHTPSGTTWSWRSCEGARCLDLVYADSQTPVSADDFLFTRNTTYPQALLDFERGFRTLEGLKCDILLTPHPSASGMFERLAAREKGDANAFVKASACREYAASARTRLKQRTDTERARR